MNRIKNIFAIGAFSLMVLALPTIASAQWRDRDRDDDYYGNARYNRSMVATVQNLRNRARNFERFTNRVEDRRDDRDDRDDRWGNRGGWYGGNVGRLEDLADRFADATNDLAREYRSDRDLRDSRNEMRRVLDLGNQIESELSRTRSRNLERQWSQIRYDLRALANYYNGGYNRYPTNRNGDWRSRVPFPLPF